MARWQLRGKSCLRWLIRRMIELRRLSYEGYRVILKAAEDEIKESARAGCFIYPLRRSLLFSNL